MNLLVTFILITFLSFSKEDEFDKTQFPQVVKVTEIISSLMAEKMKNKKVTTVTMELDDSETNTYICATDIELRGMDKFDTKYELGPGKDDIDPKPKVIVTYKFSDLFLHYGKMTEVTPYCWICWWSYVKTQEKSHPIIETPISVKFFLRYDSQGVVNDCVFWLIVENDMDPRQLVANPQYYHTMFARASFLRLIIDKFIGYFVLRFNPGNLNKVLTYLMMRRHRLDYIFAFTVQLDELFQEAATKSGVCDYIKREQDPSKRPLPPEFYVKSNKFDKYCVKGP